MSSVAATLAGTTLYRRALATDAPFLGPLLRSGGAGSPDPIFVAIAVAQSADAHLTACLSSLNENDAVAMRLADDAADISNDANRVLRCMTPTTLAGFHALVRHYAADAALDDPHSVGAWCLGHLAACLPPLPS